MSLLKTPFDQIPSTTKEQIISIAQRYRDAGYECFLVGGSCRDLLMEEVPHDFDFATNCPLEETKKLFPRVIETGEAHGTLTLLLGGTTFEITRYRKDVDTDGRRATITFAETIEEDLQRRDLRLNAIAYDVLEDRVVDSENGLDDFQRKLIHFVGTPKERIQEDHLRAIRFARFVAKYRIKGFSCRERDLETVLQTFDSSVLSIERIYDELNKINKLHKRDEDFITHYLGKLKLFTRFFGVSNLAGKVTREILKTRSLLPLGYEYAQTHSLKEAGETLKFSRQQKRLISLFLHFINQDLKDPIVFKKLLGTGLQVEPEEIVKAARILRQMDLSAQLKQVKESQEPYSIADLVVTGEDLVGLGCQGRKISEVHQLLLEEVLHNPSLNQRAPLLELAQHFSEE